MSSDTLSSIRAVENRFGRPHILVVGDLMLDKYIWGEVERISPEAPVPVLRAGRMSQQPGGAANVAMNLAQLGATVSVAGFGGGDEDQHALEALLHEAGIDPHIVECPDVPTTSKLRVLAGRQQLLRVDREGRAPERGQAAESLLQRALSLLPQAAVVVLSDYDKGALSGPTCRTLIAEAKRLQKPVVVDPKGNDFLRYRGATSICPNARELAIVTGESHRDLKRLLAVGQKLVASLNLQHMLVTLGEQGIAIVRQHSCQQVPAAARQVFDVSGAGDTVVAVVAMAMAADVPAVTAVQIANLAAGVVIGKVGTVPIHRDELLAVLSGQVQYEPDGKLMPLPLLQSQVAGWHARGLRVVFTNGCFDLLHAGHVTLLEQARRMGDRLIVGLNSDRSVRQLKGKQRPVVGEDERARVLAALAAVDAVVLFDDVTPLRLIASLRPDVLVKGGDYTEADVVGAAEMRTWGGRLELVPLVAGCSTTRILERSTDLRSAGVQS